MLALPLTALLLLLLTAYVIDGMIVCGLRAEWCWYCCNVYCARRLHDVNGLNCDAIIALSSECVAAVVLLLVIVTTVYASLI